MSYAVKEIFLTLQGEGMQAGRRAVFGYFEGWGDRARYPDDARRIRDQWFASDDALLTMVMGGEIYIPGYEAAWEIGRELGLPVRLIVGGDGLEACIMAAG